MDLLVQAIREYNDRMNRYEKALREEGVPEGAQQEYELVKVAIARMERVAEETEVGDYDLSLMVHELRQS